MSEEYESKVCIGVVACDIMKRELGLLLDRFPQVSEVIYLEVALHCYPRKMKEMIKEQIAAVKDKVDAIFLGYGYCQSLKGIEDEFDIPIVMPQMDDCIQILMTPRKYASEIRREVGTWFMTPGWAEQGAEMVIRETHSDRVVKYGKDPLQMAKRLFIHYRRGLFVNTHAGDTEHFMNRAREFCEIFDLDLDTTEGSLEVLKMHLEKTLEVALRKKKTAQDKTSVGSRS